MRTKVELEAPAKINLYLEVGPLRPDGFHSVRTVMQAVDLYDLLEVEIEPSGEAIELEVEGDAPGGGENLCLKAAAAFTEAIRRPLGVNIKLTKRIPRAAGLGGGSSDAAAVLRALNHLTEQALGPAELMRMAASLGSDVPFFLVGGTAMGEGRGERVTALSQAPPLPVLLASPGGTLSTAEVYGHFDESGGGTPPAGGPWELADRLPDGRVEEIGPLLFNSLEMPAVEIMPELGSLLESARAAGAGGVGLSGSGPTIFLIAGAEEEVEMLGKAMIRTAPVVMTTRFRSSGAVIRASEGGESCCV